MMEKKGFLLLGVLVTITFVGQIASAIFLYNPQGITWMINTGWVILWISAVFGWIPILTFKSSGGVAKGESYMKTTQLVDRGVYAIVRHPQYLAGVLIGIGLPLISQHWLVAVFGLFNVFISYYSAVLEDQSLISKFGDGYRAYMGRVPRMNFLLGLGRWILRTTSQESASF